MSSTSFPTTPSQKHYDVVIIGGATSGTSIAWHLSTNPDFSGSVLVVERDPSLQYSATKASNNCMRQQFATKINIEIAQYAADFAKRFGANFGLDPCVPQPPIRDFGYLYLSDSESFTKVLEKDQQLQSRLGAGTQIIPTTDIKERYPFFYTDDLDSGSLNTKDEGCFNAFGMVEWMRKTSCDNGIEYICNEVVNMVIDKGQIQAIELLDGERISADKVINAAGTRAAQVASLVGVELPIEARRRYTYIFSVDDPLSQDLPLTIDPSGVHLRSYADKDYLVGCPPTGADVAVDVNDFSFAENAWDEKVFPIISRRIPQFSTARVTDSWMGHYEFNTFDHNAVVGAHNSIRNFLFCVGFSGHGSQQAPACGRGIAELVVYGEFKTLDLSALSYTRILEGRPLTERAVI
ncbi:FAD dependent oxidoreductase [Aspergillus steynii IBT 23096]|uniref:FAD-dependent oxidoreductase domain-containing protein 1 n=1 Tax=Aspergillus steynii IBT 23096 TaxID=1392250 RepID=A0A2I2GK87_9EURO|nr:FAD dependent oxidoreductase [Aspergillus steynii IBT 23096]PLB53293.1 FAD dependent oxidoreductase [Aspergillus steynii IBT 23096]